MQVVEFQHVKPGKGAAFVRTKMKDIINGGVTETSFNPTAKFEQAYVERKDMEYSYNDGDLYYFMDMETYDMIPISKDMLGDAFRFVKENMTCKVMSYKGSVFGRDRSRLQGRHRHQRDQARHPGDRRRDQGAPVHQSRRQDQDRHPQRRVFGALQELMILLDTCAL